MTPNKIEPEYIGRIRRSFYSMKIPQPYCDALALSLQRKGKWCFTSRQVGMIRVGRWEIEANSTKLSALFEAKRDQFLDSLRENFGENFIIIRMTNFQDHSTVRDAGDELVAMVDYITFRPNGEQLGHGQTMDSGSNQTPGGPAQGSGHPQEKENPQRDAGASG